MDRITKWSEPCVIIEENGSRYIPDIGSPISRAITCLARYEDTGLTPEEVSKMQKEFTRAKKVHYRL